MDDFSYTNQRHPKKIQINRIQKDLPVRGKYDVVIIGGGTAGVCAAISCGREGLKTLIVEQFGSLGGTQTMAQVTPMMSSEIPSANGIYSITHQISEKMYAEGYAKGFNQTFHSWFDPQILKLVLEEMVEKSGVDVLYHANFVDVIKKGNIIEYAVIRCKDGLQAVYANSFIDCSGDADVALAVGVECNSGNEHEINQAVSLRFEMTGVKVGILSEYLNQQGQKIMMNYPILHTDGFGFAPGLQTFLREKMREGYLQEKDLSHFQMFTIPGKPSNIFFNCPELGMQKNVLDADFMSEKQIQGKKAIFRIANFMKKFIPGFENAYVSEIAPMLGIRETRRIEAEYVLTTDDILDYKKYEDSIAVSNYPVDVHGIPGNALKDSYKKDILPEEKYFDIPYRCLVPKGVDNLLVAGRCAGFDFISQSSVRVHFTCQSMGEAAGIACSLKNKTGVPFRELNGVLIKEKMNKYFYELTGRPVLSK